jgi:integrase
MSEKMIRTATPGIYKRGSRYAVVVRDRTGRQIKRSAMTLAEAKALKASLVTDIRRGEFRELSRATFADYARQWTETYTGRTGRGIRPDTLAGYADELRRFAVPHFGRMRLAEVEPRDIKAYVTELSRRGFAPNTVRLALAPVRAMFATAVEEGLIRSNPASGIRLPSRPLTGDEDDEDRVKALSEEELARVIEAVRPEWRLFVTFVAHTGMRISEAIAVRWSDVDLEAGRVHVRRRWFAGTYAPPKSRFGKRQIPLSPDLAEALARRRDAFRPAADELVWPNRSGNPLDPPNILSRVLKPAGQAAGVPWIGWHTLRHTCGSILFRHGANAKQVQHWLGHHSPAFTLSVYVHAMRDNMPDPAFLDTLTRGVTEGVTSPAETGRDVETAEAQNAAL